MFKSQSFDQVVEKCTVALDGSPSYATATLDAYSLEGIHFEITDTSNCLLVLCYNVAMLESEIQGINDYFKTVFEADVLIAKLESFDTATNSLEFSIQVFPIVNRTRDTLNAIRVMCVMIMTALLYRGVPSTEDAISRIYDDFSEISEKSIATIRSKFSKLCAGSLSEYEESITHPGLVQLAQLINFNLSTADNLFLSENLSHE